MVKAGKITAGTLTTAGVITLTFTFGGSAAALAAAAGNLGLLGVAGTGTAITTLSGAALTSALLAAIGGSVAAGAAIIAAVGTGLGGVAGAVLTSKYVGEDKSFNIHLLQRNKSSLTIFINGFLQEKDETFKDWQNGYLECFPSEKLYGVT